MTRQLELPKQPALAYDVELLANPSQAQLRELALAHTPFCVETIYGNINKVARNKARMAQHTYVIDRAGDPAAFSHKTIEPARAQALIDAPGAIRDLSEPLRGALVLGAQSREGLAERVIRP